MVNKSVIIGAGPAGIAAAIQLKRYNIEPIVLEQKEAGGLLRNANLVENYPGFPKGISGVKLAELFKRQLKSAKVKVSFEPVLDLNYKGENFSIKTARRVIRAGIVVIASGTKPKKLSGVFQSTDIKSRLFYEVYPILGVKNKKIVIIGAGDAAFDYALNLSPGNEVIILNRNNQPKCIPALKKRCLESKRISCLPNLTVKEINYQDKKTVLTCIDIHREGKEKIYADYVIAAVGRVPALDFLKSSFKKEFNRLIKSNKLFPAGDVKNGLYRQAAISVGDGVKAAMKIYGEFQ